MKILITGSTGFLGGYLVPKLVEGNEVYALVRMSNRLPKGCKPLVGDVTNLSMLGMPDFEEIWSLAGVVNLSKHVKDVEVNFEGARQVVELANRQKVKRLVHISTAYTREPGQWVNPYEESKWRAERYIRENCKVPALVFKPGILIAKYPGGVLPEGIRPGAFYEFTHRVARFYMKFDKVRRAIESTMRLPPVELVLRVTGNPEGKLNLVPVNVVADSIFDLAQKYDEATLYITNNHPPLMKNVLRWIGEAVGIHIRVQSSPSLSPPEMAFGRIVGDFLPYLQGDDFPSSITCPPVNARFVHRTLAHFLGKAPADD